MVILRAEGLMKYYGSHWVLKGIDLEIQEQDRIGIVGRNGSGKTTLFKLLCGLEKIDEGSMTLKRGLKVGYLEQMPSAEPTATGETVLREAFKALSELEAQMLAIGQRLENEGTSPESEALLHQLDDLQKRFELLGGYETEQNLKRVCDGLGLTQALLDQAFGDLSGGEKTRMMLGRILLEAPDVLLLDEPTNHLDLDALVWLEGYLKQYRGAVLIISHDREFLDQTAKAILAFDDGRAKLWPGNYTTYKKDYDTWLFQQIEAYKAQQKKIREMEEAIKRFEDWGARADNPAMFAKARNMAKRIEKMDKVDRPNANEKTMGLEFKSEGRTGNLVFVLRQVSGGYGNRMLFEGLNGEVLYQDCAVLMGANGSGKTTLFKMLLGQHPLARGELKVGSRVKLGYLEQEVSFPNEGATVFECFNEATMIGEFQARGKLARFMFFSEDLSKKVGSLSGGERVRLKLCLMMEEGINVLLLDEPTNHMDIPSREVLELALEHFKGTVLMISHDRYFVKRLATKLFFLNDAGLTSFDGSYEEWQERQHVLGGGQEAAKTVHTTKPADVGKGSSRPLDTSARNRQNELRRAHQRLEVINPLLSKRQDQLVEVVEALANPELSYEELMLLTQKQQVLEEEVENLGLEWLTLTEFIES